VPACTSCPPLEQFSAKYETTQRAWFQWSFRKTGTMGTLASQAEIDVWLQALGGGAAGEKFEIVYAKSCSLVHFWSEFGSHCVLKHFNNGNAVAMLCGSFSTMGSASPSK